MAYQTSATLIRAVMEADSGLPEDRFINDFAFYKAVDGVPSAGDYDNLFTAVDEFFNHTETSTFKVAQFISAAVDRAATHELQAYHIAAGPLGSPVATSPWLGPSTPLSSTPMPTEVAGVLSFHADLTGVLEESGATRPRARRRGRVYIGPLVISATDGASQPALDTSFLSTLRQAAIFMHDTAETDGWVWAVWSRADATLREVVAGWTDNAPDTQRRRGQASTARVTYTV